MSQRRRNFLRKSSAGVAGSLCPLGKLVNAASAPSSPATSNSRAIARSVQPLIGTGWRGHIFPGAVASFGLVQLIPPGRRSRSGTPNAIGTDGITLRAVTSPAVSWEWYKCYNADALRIVAAMDLTGATLSNYGKPLFELWNEAGWHQTGNAYFQTGPY